MSGSTKTTAISVHRSCLPPSLDFDAGALSIGGFQTPLYPDLPSFLLVPSLCLCYSIITLISSLSLAMDHIHWLLCDEMSLEKILITIRPNLLLGQQSHWTAGRSIVHLGYLRKCNGGSASADTVLELM
jgi:hypothetical protein